MRLEECLEFVLDGRHWHEGVKRHIEVSSEDHFLLSEVDVKNRNFAVQTVESLFVHRDVVVHEPLGLDDVNFTLNALSFINSQRLGHNLDGFFVNVFDLLGLFLFSLGLLLSFLKSLLLCKVSLLDEFLALFFRLVFGRHSELFDGVGTDFFPNSSLLLDKVLGKAANHFSDHSERVRLFIWSFASFRD